MAGAVVPNSYISVVGNVPAVTVTKTLNSAFKHRSNWAGDGYIAGEPQTGGTDPLPDGRVKRNNVPYSLRVVVYAQDSGVAVAETISNSDGTYYIGNLKRTYSDGNPYLYFVIVIDHTGVYNGAIQTHVQPVLMP